MTSGCETVKDGLVTGDAGIEHKNTWYFTKVRPGGDTTISGLNFSWLTFQGLGYNSLGLKS